MKKLISAGLWMAGGLFFAVSSGILSACLFILPREMTFRMARALFKILIRIMGITLSVHGRENIQKGRPYLIMGNHQSLFDVFVIPAAIPICFVGIEAAYHFSFPVWGYLIQKWGCIPIERENLTKAILSLDLARKTLAQGMSIGVLPEGHRTRTGAMGPFKKGPFYLAKEAGADILPFGIHGLFEFNPKGSFLLNPGKVIVNIGKPVPYETVKDFSVEELRNYFFDIISGLSQKKEPGR
nr:1-acyl-sn-glycerol-3-phosphate acyltransferase [Desulfobacula sp.]